MINGEPPDANGKGKRVTCNKIKHSPSNVSSGYSVVDGPGYDQIVCDYAKIPLVIQYRRDVGS